MFTEHFGIVLYSRSNPGFCCCFYHRFYNFLLPVHICLTLESFCFCFLQEGSVEEGSPPPPPPPELPRRPPVQPAKLTTTTYSCYSCDANCDSKSDSDFQVNLRQKKKKKNGPKSLITCRPGNRGWV